MKNFQLFLSSILICVSLSGCKKEINEPDPINPPISGGSSYFGNTIQLNVAGQVFDESGASLEGVVIKAGFGNHTTTTDANGAFMLQGISGYDRLGYVTATKAGYFTGSRSFVPVDGTNTVRIMLLAKNFAGAIQGNLGGSVEAEGVQITFLAGSLTRNGIAYTGPVNVALNHIDPSNEDLFQQMPGALIGTMDNSAQMLRSFGMVGVELTDGAGMEVEIVDGSSAEVRFPVPSTMISEAASTIDLWSFDEDLGHWVHEGQAQLVGSEYVANVGHFSWWNCDVPMPLTHLEGQVLDQGSGQPIGGVRVTLINDIAGEAVAYTNEDGVFGGVIPSGASMDLQIEMSCSNGAWDVIHSSAIGPFTYPTELQFNVQTPMLSTLVGSIVDCGDQPVSAGYIMLNGQAHFMNNGQFNVTVCTNDFEFFAVDQTNGIIGGTEQFTPVSGLNNLGTINVCGQTISEGTVTDIDGNVYTTVLIGTQEWLGENLRTSRFSNGDPISNVQSSSDWAVTTTPAWRMAYSTNYENNFGKMYNWFVVGDQRNVCPSGWHVPSDDEWKELELTLGMPVSVIDGVGYWRGSPENVGGKLKAVSTAWGSPNEGATNESMFTALPGGTIYSYTGDFGGLGNTGMWWTTSDSSSDAWNRYMSFMHAGVHRSLTDKKNGYHIRCIRD